MITMSLFHNVFTRWLNRNSERIGRHEEGPEAAHGVNGLPQDCLSAVISSTTPSDACRLALASRFFKSAAECDVVWDRFLPVDYKSLIPQSLLTASKKQIYFYLSHNPVLIQGGKKSFWLEKRSARKCYMLAARELEIAWGDNHSYWEWHSHPNSRFCEVAQLRAVCWLDIRCKISARDLSPEAHYAAYLVFNIKDDRDFYYQPVEVGVGANKNYVYLCEEHRSVVDYRTRFSEADNWKNGCDFGYLKYRNDGWSEVELGEFFNKKSENDEEEIEMFMREIRCLHWKEGIIVQGVEIRPKDTVNGNTLTQTNGVFYVGRQ